MAYVTAAQTIVSDSRQRDHHDIVGRWQGSVVHSECTLHQIAPYIGKMKSSMAAALVSEFSRKGDVICDPFCGAGTVALEAWSLGRQVTACDLSPYAVLLTRAKLSPPSSVNAALAEVDTAAKHVASRLGRVDLRRVPRWVREFFHNETLREVLAWTSVLQEHNSEFLLACLMGILHHQRPGFLSYPSSHTVPYLRQVKFPPKEFPELYQYRPVRERLERKVARAMKRLPPLPRETYRICLSMSADQLAPNRQVNAIITSPPYMRQLDYGRDNRLRLWFLGCKDWSTLDETISPSETRFLKLMTSCLSHWRSLLLPGGVCVLVLGDSRSRLYGMPLPDVVAHIARENVGGYTVQSRYTESIPYDRRVRRGYCGSLAETVLVLRKESGDQNGD